MPACFGAQFLAGRPRSGEIAAAGGRVPSDAGLRRPRLQPGGAMRNGAIRFVPGHGALALAMPADPPPRRQRGEPVP